jgi:hypothetical protein
LDDHFLGAWQNDDSYYDPSFDPVTISAGVNDDIDFTDDDGSFIGVVAPATYTDGATLATAVATAMNATATTQTHASSFSTASMRHTINNTTGALLTLPWNTGPSSAGGTGTTIGNDLNFDTSADDSGSLSYEADNSSAVGGAAGTTRVVLSGSSFEMDVVVEPAATSARVLGPVQDFGGPIAASGLFYAASESGSSVVDNSAGDSTRQIEVRAHSASFNATDAGATTDIDWTLVTRGTNMAFAAKQWWQQRAVLRNNGV